MIGLVVVAGIFGVILLAFLVQLVVDWWRYLR